MMLTAIEQGEAEPSQYLTAIGDQRGKWLRKGKTDEGARRRGRLELALEQITCTELALRVGRTVQAVSACRKHKTWVSDEWMPAIEQVLSAAPHPGGRSDE